MFHPLIISFVAATKDELLDIIQHGAEQIVTSKDGYALYYASQNIADAPLFDSFDSAEDIEAIITRGEERTAELNSKWEGLNFDELSNFKLDGGVQQWEGEDFQNRVRGIVLVSFPNSSLWNSAQNDWAQLDTTFQARA